MPSSARLSPLRPSAQHTVALRDMAMAVAASGSGPQPAAPHAQQQQHSTAGANNNNSNNTAALAATGMVLTPASTTGIATAADSIERTSAHAPSANTQQQQQRQQQWARLTSARATHG